MTPRLLGAAAALLVTGTACLPALGPTLEVPRLSGSNNVLFIGNSQTYVNDLPAMVRALARAAGETSLQVAQVAAPDYALEDHFIHGAARAAIEGSRWRFVVMQQGPSALPSSQQHLRTWAEAFAPIIDAAEAEPVLYQIWPSADRRFDADAALTSYWNAAAALGGILAPAGDAFTAALEAEPPLAPYSRDGLHGSVEGTYLAAVVLVARMFDIAPESLPPTIPGRSLSAERVRRLQAAARLALERSPARPQQPCGTTIALHPDTSFFPEGLAVDPRDGALLVTSIHRRNVWWRPADAAPRWLLDDATAAGIGAVLGVALDTARAVAWLTTAKLPMMQARAGDASLRAELIEITYPAGAVQRRFVLGDGDGVPGELAITPGGDVLVSDGARGRLYRLRRGASALEAMPFEGLRSPQGIAVREDGAVAFVADWSRGLWRWDLRQDSLTPLTTSSGQTLRGVDGLRWHAGALIAIQNGTTPNRVLRVRLDDGARAIGEVAVLDAPSLAGEMTVGAVRGDSFVYVASSAWPFWTEQGARRKLEQPLPPVVLRAIPLRP